VFDWLRFLNSHGIPYVTSGPNTSKGRPAIKCPYCGSADPSEHLNLHRDGHWRCFRNPRAHSGRSPIWLIQALLNCSQEEAKRLAGEEASPPPADNDLAAQVAKNMRLEPTATARPQKLEFPPEFKPLAEQGVRPLAAPFWNYLLQDRGYTTPQVNWLVFNYRLHYAVRGPYRYRLIIPIYDAGERLQTWTARSIVSGETLRYKTLPTHRVEGYDYDGLLALKPPGQLLLGLPLLLRAPNPQTLVLCEGPFDAMRITALGRQKGVYGTCLFGLNISEVQVSLLDRLMSRFNRLVLLLDPDAQYLTLRIKEHLTPQVVTVGKLPEGIEDPGALPAVQGHELIQSWV
jgi:hypothetical protein